MWAENAQPVGPDEVVRRRSVRLPTSNQARRRLVAAARSAARPVSLMCIRVSRTGSLATSSDSFTLGLLSRALSDTNNAVILLSVEETAAAILPRTDTAAAIKHAHRLIERVLRNFPPPQPRVCIGIASTPETSPNLSQLVDHAQAALDNAWNSPDEMIRLAPGGAMMPPLQLVISTELETPLRAVQEGVPYFAIPHDIPTADLVNLVPSEVARRLNVVPVAREGRLLTVAMCNPSDPATVRYLSASTGFAIYPVMSGLDDVTAAIERLERAEEFGRLAQARQSDDVAVDVRGRFPLLDVLTLVAESNEENGGEVRLAGLAEGEARLLVDRAHVRDFLASLADPNGRAARALCPEEAISALSIQIGPGRASVEAADDDESDRPTAIEAAAPASE